MISKLYFLLRLALALCCIAGTSLQAQALTPPVATGLAWLQNQVQPDGGVAGANVANAFAWQTQAQTAQTFRILGANVPPALLSRISQPADGFNTHTQAIASQILGLQAAQQNSQAALSQLLSLQNPDGGFGTSTDRQSNALDTAYALQALSLSSSSTTSSSPAVTQAINRALAYLPSSAVSLGSYGVNGYNSIYVSAQAAQALWHYRHSHSAAVQTPLSQAQQWLLNQRSGAGHWGTSLATAHALAAILPSLSDTSSVQAGLDALRNAQSANGSWDNDPYITALALRVLHGASLPAPSPDFVGQPAPNPDVSSLAGRLLDAQTQQPLPLFAVRISTANPVQQHEVQTDSQGRFSFNALVAAHYSLLIPAQGEYQMLQAPVALATGQHSDAGAILLNRNAAHPSSAIVIGTVSHATTGVPIAGAHISAGGLSTTSAADGRYQILGLSPGTVALHISAPNFHSAAAQATAGATVLFSPALTPLAVSGNPGGATQDGSISGIVVDALTQQPLANVAIAVSGAFNATTQTAADGSYRISPLAAPGTISLSTDLAGYAQASAAANVVLDSVLVFSPQLLAPTHASDKGQVFGTVLDAATGQPLEDAQISMGALQTSTDADGRYRFDNVALGSARLVASKVGYSPAAAEGHLTAGSLMEFSPALQMATPALSHSVIFGRIRSVDNQAVVAGAQIEATGAQNTYRSSTAADGSYRIDDVVVGNYSVTVTHPDFMPHSTNFDLPAFTEMEVSPLLSANTNNSAVSVPNSATLSGRLLDSVTGRPVANATYVVAAGGERGVNKLGRFNILGVRSSTAEVTFNAPGYYPLISQFAVQTLAPQDVGDITMERIIAARLPDLVATQFDVSATHSNPSTLMLAGSVAVTLSNQGAQSSPSTQPIDILVFEDRNQNGLFDAATDLVVGRSQITGGLEMGQSKSTTIAVAGNLRYRDAPLRLWVDSGNAVLELDEANNTDLHGTAPNRAALVVSTGAEFNAGSKINVALDGSGNALQLSETTRAFNTIWIANSSLGTVMKVDITTGEITGEYRSAPQGKADNPSRTTVDKNGNVWVGNRNEGGWVAQDAIGPGLPPEGGFMGSAIKIGLLENGQCEDRNGNGVIDTSTGAGDIRNWQNLSEQDTLGGIASAEDECILAYVRVNSSGTRHISVNRHNQVWVSGTGGRHFDLVSEQGDIIRQESSVGYGGYGGLIDANDVIWSSTSGSLLRWDTHNPLTGANGDNWQGINRGSYGLCIDSLGNVWDSQGSVYRPDGTLLRTYAGGGKVVPWTIKTIFGSPITAAHCTIKMTVLRLGMSLRQGLLPAYPPMPTARFGPLAAIVIHALIPMQGHWD